MYGNQEPCASVITATFIKAGGYVALHSGLSILCFLRDLNSTESSLCMIKLSKDMRSSLPMVCKLQDCSMVCENMYSGNSHLK